MRIHVDNLVWGRRGPSSVVLIEDDAGAVYYGAIWYREGPGGGEEVATVEAAREYVEVHADEIVEALRQPYEPGVWAEPGLAPRPGTERVMLERAKHRAGWDGSE